MSHMLFAFAEVCVWADEDAEWHHQEGEAESVGVSGCFRGESNRTSTQI